MFRKQDPYSYTENQTLYLADEKGEHTSIGLLISDYQVSLYNDVQVLTTGSVAQPDNQQFILTVTQRILLKNPNGSSVSPQTVPTTGEAFNNYPALFTATVSILDENGSSTDGVTLNLLDYSPQTVNTAVQQNTSSATSNEKNTTTSSTTGSSYSQASTYGVSVTAGDTFAGVTASVEYSASKTNDSSSSNAAGASSSNQASSGDSMSIKDWGSYASVNPLSEEPTWVFGQEFPWNAIECRFTPEQTIGKKGQVQILISSSMANNLYDGAFLYPPSELSLYGSNFVMKGVWRVYVDLDSSPKISICHPIGYYSASHELVEPDPKVVPKTYIPVVSLDVAAANLVVKDTKNDGSYIRPTVTLDLNVMGLDPIGVNNPAAIIGFLPNRIIPPPTLADAGKLAKGFRTLATTNDLMIDDTTLYDPNDTGNSGFVASETSLTVNLSAAQTVKHQITVYFKIVDSVNEYTLMMKHWKTGDVGLQLTFVVNGDANQTFTKFVDSKEGEGGEANTLQASLRDLDFSSIEYHDYLQLGLNSVSITIEPIGGKPADAGYQIRALTVVRE